MYSRGLDAYPGQVRLWPLLVDLPAYILAHNPQKNQRNIRFIFDRTFATVPLVRVVLWCAASMRRLVTEPATPVTDQVSERLLRPNRSVENPPLSPPRGESGP